MIERQPILNQTPERGGMESYLLELPQHEEGWNLFDISEFLEPEYFIDEPGEFDEEVSDMVQELVDDSINNSISHEVNVFDLRTILEDGEAGIISGDTVRAASISEVDVTEVGASEKAVKSTFASFLDTLLRIIPLEIITLWIAIDTFFTITLRQMPLFVYWIVFMFLSITVLPYVYISIDKTNILDMYGKLAIWWQSIAAMIAFIVWVYYLGGPFEAQKIIFGHTIYSDLWAGILVVLYSTFIATTPVWGEFLAELLGLKAVEDI